MKDKLLEVVKKNKSIILYIFFGGCTTVLNVLCFYLLCNVLKMQTVTGNVLSWFVAVVFAYITNSIFVYESKTRGFKKKVIEIINFFLARIATGVLDTAIMFLMVDILAQNGVVWKIITNVIVIVLNYILGKWIFKKK